MNHPFDELAKGVAGGMSRRQALGQAGRLLAATVLGAVGLLGLTPKAAAYDCGFFCDCCETRCDNCPLTCGRCEDAVCGDGICEDCEGVPCEENPQYCPEDCQNLPPT
jgi:hypothetical protein